MICIAAFIILLIIWLFTPALKLLGFKKQAKSINQMFKKSMHCFSRRVTLRACDSNFKDEIKNSISALSEGTKDFAARRMNRTILEALQGKSVDEV